MLKCATINSVVYTSRVARPAPEAIPIASSSTSNRGNGNNRSGNNRNGNSTAIAAVLVRANGSSSNAMLGSATTHRPLR